MDDSLFLANLYKSDLLPGDLKASVESLSTPAMKATRFLDAVIKPAITNNQSERFNLLLSTMKICDNTTVKCLGEEIMNLINDQQFNYETGKQSMLKNYIEETVR